MRIQPFNSLTNIGLCGLLLLGPVLHAIHAAEPDGGDTAWAEENLNAGRYKEAVELLRKAVPPAENDALKPSPAAYKLTRALWIVGEYAEALKLCEQMLKAEPKDAWVACLKGELLTEAGRYKDAIQVFDALVENDPKHYRAWALRKRVAAILGDKQAVKRTGDMFFELYQKNVDHYNSDKVADAMEPAYIGLGIQDEMPKDAFEVGFMLSESLIEKRALKEPEAFLWAARLAEDKFHFGEAAKRYQSVLKMRPRLPDAQVGLARVLFSSQHDINKAEPLLKQALEVNPHHIEAHLVQAVIDITEDKSDSAKKHIDSALAINPNHLDALTMLAFYHHDLKQPEKEAEYEKKVLAINPRHAEHYCLMGELIEDKRGFGEAAEYYKKAIALDPEYWRGYYGLGMNTSRQGAHGEEEGKRLLLKAFDMNKFNVWASNMIKVLDKFIGDKEQSVAPVYGESKTPHFNLKFRIKEAEIVRPYMEEWAESAYAWQTKKFAFEPQGPLSIELCYSFQDQAARTVGLPNLGALGVCFGKLCTVVSPREGKGNHPPFNWRKVLEHEFGHVMTLQMSEYRVPRWYTEAFSTYLEDDSRIKSDEMMVNAIAKDQLKKIENMNEYFRGNMLMAYVHGRYIIESIDKLNGFESHKQALRLFAEGKKAEAVLPQVTGKTLEQLNSEQFDYVRKFFKNVRLRPAFDQADFARMEMAASSADAPAQAVADLAIAYASTRQFPRAEACALKALEKDAKCVDAINVLGALSYNKKDLNGAKKLYEDSTRLDADKSFSAWLHLGVIYRKEGRTTKSIETFERARKVYPRYVGPDNPHHVLPELYMDQEPPQSEKALAVWTDAVAVNSEDADAARKGLKLAVELKNWAAAAKFAMAHIEIDPYDPEVHRLAGRTFEELKDLPRAAREYYVGTRVDEKDVESFVSLARVELARGRRDEAAKAVNAALEIDGTHEGAKALRKELGL